MPNLPTTEELRKAGEQAVAAARTPLLAALGAGDLAAKAVIEALNKAKERVEAGKTAAESTDFTGLKEKFDPAELRKVVDAYTQSALNLYQFLAEHGQEALDKIKAAPQVQKAIHQVEEAVETAQKRTGAAAADARELADDVLGKVTRRTRSAGEKVANDVDDATEKLAETVVEVGGDVAHEVRSTTRKAANRTAAARTTPVRKPAAPRTTTAKKPGGTTK
jgi:heparin binding hemagglutinin HbhA